MPLQQLRLYDILVDIIPGICAIYMVKALLPQSTISFLAFQGPTGGVALIVAGYIAGRAIHAVSGLISDYVSEKWVNSVWKLRVNSVEGQQPTTRLGKKMKYISKPLDWKIQLRKSIPVEEDESIIDEIFDENGQPNNRQLLIHLKLDQNMMSRLGENLATVYQIEAEDVDSLRYFAYSRLYPKQALYQRYNILATFFRNIAFIAWIFGVITLIQGIMAVIGISIFSTQSPWLQWEVRSLVPIASLSAGVLFSRQLQLHSNSRNRHLVIDLFQCVRQENWQQGMVGQVQAQESAQQ